MLFTTLFSLVAVASAAAVDFTGYMVDAYCWNQPDHFAETTQTALDVSPQDHTLECLRMEMCRAELILLEEGTDGKYAEKYYFSQTLNRDGLTALQNLLDYNTTVGASSLIAAEGAHRMARVHITATADDSDARLLTGVSANIEGLDTQYTADMDPAPEPESEPEPETTCDCNDANKDASCTEVCDALTAAAGIAGTALILVIVLPIVGCLLVASLIGLAVYCCCCKGKKAAAGAPAQPTAVEITKTAV